MSFNLNALKIVIFGSVGEVTEKRLNKIQEHLGRDRFPIVGIGQGAPVGMVLNPEKGQSRVLAPDHFIISSEGQNIVVNFEEVSNDIKIIKNIFLFDEKTRCQIHIVGTFKVSGVESAMNKTLELDSSFKDELIRLVPNVIGVGHRFLIQNNNNISEIKFEPYIQDQSKFFVEAIFNENEPQDTNMVINMAEHVYNKVANDFYRFCIEHLVKH